ncbi:MAG: hypothetical protein ACOVOE_16010 [Caulobacter sp.]
MPEGVDDVTLHGPAFERRVQIKSRHDPKGLFSIAEIAGYIAKAAGDLPADWAASPALSLALVLERDVDGLEPTGWARALGDGGTQTDLTAAVSAALPAEFDVEALLRRAYLVVAHNPMQAAATALEPQGSEMAGLAIAAQRLRVLAGDIADANFLAKPPDVGRLGRTDVQRELDAVSSLIDPAGYLALTAGLADIADFASPMPGDSFYEGVNVAPGHVGAGLVFERPEATAALLEALGRRNAVLVAGPSGAGKSAVAWLTAYQSRHAIRWYRLRRVLPGDIARIAALAKRLDASPDRPIGLVVDDVGGEDTTGWDALVKEVEASAGLLVIGTAREEDLFVLKTATTTPIVRPQLDAPLAERIWRALYDAGHQAFSHWREPFEQSQGLLLEYTHLLTAGKRLAETLTSQVHRRLIEDRGDELTLLRAVAFASAHGGAIAPDRFQVHAGIDTFRFAKALQRLVDEHAVRIRGDGAIAGLHDIRSLHLDAAIRDLLGEPRNTALTAAATTLTADTFAAFIPRVLRTWPETADALFDALAQRVTGADLASWIGVFHGLGLATADEIARRWLEISRTVEIEDRHSETMFGLALAGATFGDEPIFARFNQAQRAFAEVDVSDLRRAVLDRLPEDESPPVVDLATAHELAAALLPVHGARSPPTLSFTPDGDLSAAPLEEIVDLLETLRERDVGLADSLAAAAGGVAALLARVHLDTPWSTPPRLEIFEGQPAVHSNLFFIHPETQPDLREAALAYGRRLAAVAPETERFVCDVIGADGEPFAIGDHRLVSLRLTRRALTAQARIAWNRAQLRAVTRLVATGTDTGRATAVAGAIREIEVAVREAGDFYCRNLRPDGRWQALLSIRKLLVSFVDPPGVAETTSGPRGQGALAGGDRLYSFLTGLHRLMTELTDGVSDQPALMAVRTLNLARDAASLRAPEVWRNTAEPPIAALESLEADLLDVRAVLADAAAASSERATAALRFTTVSRKHSVLARAASAARERADQAVASRRVEIASAFAARGVEVEVIAKPLAKDEGWLWPAVEYAAFHRVDSVLDFVPLEPILAEVGGLLDRRHNLTFAPVVRGWLAPFGFRFVQTVWPEFDMLGAWGEHSPYPALAADPAREEVERAFDALFVVASISAIGRDLNPVEDALLEQQIARVSEAVTAFRQRVASSGDPLLLEVLGLLARLCERVGAEAETQADVTFGSEVMRMMRGELTPLTQQMASARFLLIDAAAQAQAAAVA